MTFKKIAYLLPFFSVIGSGGKERLLMMKNTFFETSRYVQYPPFLENYSVFKFQPMRVPDDFISVLKLCS